jgi:hypothetical protein
MGAAHITAAHSLNECTDFSDSLNTGCSGSTAVERDLSNNAVLLSSPICNFLKAV